MAANPKYSHQVAAAIAALCNNGYLEIYDGAQPADANTAITTQNLLATLRFANPAFPADVGGVLTANAIAAVAIAQTGNAAWYRVYESDGVTVVMDGNVATAAANMILNSIALQVGASLAVTSLTVTIS